MATCRDVITNALKLGRVIASGETPSADEAADGMKCLQSLYDSWVTGGMFGELEDVYLEDDDVAEEGKRYYVPAGVSLTVPTSEYLDAVGNTRQPRDLAIYESLTSTGTRIVRVYDRTAWVGLLDLTLNDDAPLSGRSEMGLAACLATSGAFAAMFNDTATMNPDVRRLAQMFYGHVMAPATTRDDRTADYY